MVSTVLLQVKDDSSTQTAVSPSWHQALGFRHMYVLLCPVELHSLQ